MCRTIVLEKALSHDESCSDGCEHKILEGISLGTKIYDRVLKLIHNAVKQKILDTCSYELWKKKVEKKVECSIQNQSPKYAFYLISWYYQAQR